MRVLTFIFLSGVLLKGYCQPSQPLKCQNGGILSNSTCKCRWWKGFDCSEIICVNSGYPSSTNRCVCPTGYLGVHCEAVTTNKAPLTLFTSSTTFNIVYYNMFSDYWGNSSYSDFQDSVRKHIQKFSYDEYNMLCVFKNSRDYTNSTSNKDDFLKLFKPQKFPDDYSCFPVPIYDKLYKFITDKELRETAITILTQHPPAKNDTYMKKLENIALSFQIRINVIWSHDDIFVRCDKNDSRLTELRLLVHSTGGFFISEKYGPKKVDGSLIDVVISSHHNYQSIAMNVTNKDSLNIIWKGGPQLERMYLVIEGQALPNISSCNLKHLGTTVFGDTAVYSYDSIARCALELHGDVTIARVFTSNTKRRGVQIYTSYVENNKIDSSNYLPNNSSYLAMHIHTTDFSNVTVKNATVHVGPGKNIGLTIVSRNATFDFISTEPFPCSTNDTLLWIDVVITATTQSNQYTIQRYIPYKCYQKSAQKVARLFKPRSSTAHTSVSVTTTTPDKNYLESERNNSCGNLTATFALAYSNSLDTLTYQAFMKQSLKSPIKSFNNYGDILFDIGNLTYESYTSYSDFIGSIYNRKLTKPESDYKPSNVLEALQKIASDTMKNSLISVALKKLPLEIVTSVSSFVNNNNKVIFFIDKDDFTHENSTGRKSNTINTIAALTNGHFIVSNQRDITNFSEILSYIYKFGPSQELLFASTFVYKSPSFTLGTIDLTNFKENITVSITVSIAVSTCQHGASKNVVCIQNMNFAQNPFKLIFKAGNTSHYKYLKYQEESNFFFYSNVTLEAKKYEVSGIFIARFLGPDILIRFWTPKMNTSVEIEYYSLNNTLLLDGPNEIDGAAVKASIENFSKEMSPEISINILDCAGNLVDLYDSKQSVNVSSNSTCYVAQFVPFFCSYRETNNPTCVNGSENKYSIQISANSQSDNFFLTRSFMCGKGSSPFTCNEKDTMGNIQCNGEIAPFYRGPTGKVLYCSGSGHLVYNNSAYECQCDGGYNGTSCEIGECSEQNTTLDTFYRTYTVVIGIDTSSDLPESIFENVNKTARIDETSVIWQYQLIIYTAESEVIPLYIGNNYEHFIRSLNFTKWNVNPQMESAALNLTRVYESAVSAVGRQSKGLIFFYVENADINVTLSEFYSVAQQYRQQLYIFRNEDDEYSPNEAVIEATFSTGGCYIPCSGEDKNFPQVFSEILRSETSLNIQSFNRTINTLTVENNAYAFVFGLEITGQNPLTSGLYNLTSGNYTIKITNSTLNWISLVEINGTVPLHAILSSRTDDTDTAVGSNTTATSPILAFSLPEEWSVKDIPSLRTATRPTCTFNRTAYSIQRATEGVSMLKLVTTASNVAKIIPIIISSKLVCENGGTPNSGKCSCPEGYEGPDCSRPICSIGGCLNTWRDACSYPINADKDIC